MDVVAAVVYTLDRETGEFLWATPTIAQNVITNIDGGTGEVLWEINLGSPVSGFPITYAVDGRQYVAASTTRSVGFSAVPEVATLQVSGPWTYWR